MKLCRELQTFGIYRPPSTVVGNNKKNAKSIQYNCEIDSPSFTISNSITLIRNDGATAMNIINIVRVANSPSYAKCDEILEF